MVSHEDVKDVMKLIFKKDVLENLKETRHKNQLQLIKIYIGKGKTEEARILDAEKNHSTEVRNLEIKLNRKINVKPNKIHNFETTDLAELLANMFNSTRKPNEALVNPKVFLGEKIMLDVVGETIDNGSVIMYPKKRKYQVEVEDTDLSDCFALVHKGRVLTNVHYFYNKSNVVTHEADRNFGIGQCKKTKKIHYGWLVPKGDGYYDVDSMDIVTGKKIQTIVSNCDLAWSAKLITGKFLLKE